MKFFIKDFISILSMALPYPRNRDILLLFSLISINNGNLFLGGKAIGA